MLYRKIPPEFEGSPNFLVLLVVQRVSVANHAVVCELFLDKACPHNRVVSRLRCRGSDIVSIRA